MRGEGKGGVHTYMRCGSVHTYMNRTENKGGGTQWEVRGREEEVWVCSHPHEENREQERGTQ